MRLSPLPAGSSVAGEPALHWSGAENIVTTDCAASDAPQDGLESFLGQPDAPPFTFAEWFAESGNGPLEDVAGDQAATALVPSAVGALAPSAGSCLGAAALLDLDHGPGSTANDLGLPPNWLDVDAAVRAAVEAVAGQAGATSAVNTSATGATPAQAAAAAATASEATREGSATAGGITGATTAPAAATITLVAAAATPSEATRESGAAADATTSATTGAATTGATTATGATTIGPTTATGATTIGPGRRLAPRRSAHDDRRHAGDQRHDDRRHDDRRDDRRHVHRRHDDPRHDDRRHDDRRHVHLALRHYATGRRHPPGRRDQ